MEKQKHIGYAVHSFDKLMDKNVEAARMRYGMDNLDRMHGWVLAFLHRNMDRDIYQKDVEAEFSIGKSTVTNMVKLLESEGYIRREEVKSDARLKKITLTELGIKRVQDTMAMFDELELSTRGQIAPDRLQIFFEVLEEMKQNIENKMGETTC